MAGYTKLFGSILDSTIWRESDKIRILWITMLAMAGRDGVVESSTPGLADRSRLSREDVDAGLEALMSPDADSRTREHEGRRIEAVDGGWLILNHGKYRAKLSLEERREYQRLWQRESRAKKKASKTKGQVAADYRRGEAAFVAASNGGATDAQAMAASEKAVFE